MLEPYAIVTARNVVATMWRDARPHGDRNQHRVVDLRHAGGPDETVLAGEEQAAIAEALGRLRERERETLLAHEVAGQDTRTLARETGIDSRRGGRAAEPDPGAAARRVPAGAGAGRAADRPVPAGAAGAVRRGSAPPAGGRRRPPRARVRPVRPAQRAADGPRPEREDEVRIPISRDADIVAARQAARELASPVRLSAART